MKREFIIDVPMLEIQRNLRNINARLIRMIPRNMGNGKEAYVILYIINQ